jgi:hypothetical protein
MKWNELYNSEKMPTFENIEDYIGIGSKLWTEIFSFIEKTYQIKPKMAYSKCAMQPGWNVKFIKGSKSLCTLYPMEGYFIALVVVGSKEENEVEFALNTFSSYMQELYKKTPYSCGGRWLMIETRDKDIVNDIKRLINIRVKPKVKA